MYVSSAKNRRRIIILLIIAIPKSASTSLLKTLGDLYNFPKHQRSIIGYKESIGGFKFIWQLHSDMKEINSKELIDELTVKDRFCKQHFLPIDSNLKLLLDKKIVIVLRNPVDVIKAYINQKAILLFQQQPTSHFLFLLSQMGYL